MRSEGASTPGEREGDHPDRSTDARVRAPPSHSTNSRSGSRPPGGTNLEGRAILSEPADTVPRSSSHQFSAKKMDLTYSGDCSRVARSILVRGFRFGRDKPKCCRVAAPASDRSARSRSVRTRKESVGEPTTSYGGSAPGADAPGRRCECDSSTQGGRSRRAATVGCDPKSERSVSRRTRFRRPNLKFSASDLREFALQCRSGGTPLDS